MINAPDLIAVIMQCYHPAHVEIVSSVLEIATNICWLSDEGFDMVFRSFESYKVERNQPTIFEPLLRSLESANAVILSTVCAFLNTLLESPSDEKVRNRVRSLLHGNKVQ